jgi:hypothetical protein
MSLDLVDFGELACFRAARMRDAHELDESVCSFDKPNVGFAIERISDYGPTSRGQLACRLLARQSDDFVPVGVKRRN